MKRKLNRFIQTFLVISLLSSIFIADINLPVLAADRYFSSVEYDKLRKIHMTDMNNASIDIMIDGITEDDKAIDPLDVNGTRSLNPFVYQRYGNKVVYGTPDGIPNNEFANSSDGTMANWVTGQRGEYKYLGYNYNGVEVTNDKFIRPTAGNWLNSPQSYTEINWTVIQPERKTEETWENFRDPYIGWYLMNTQFTDTDYTGTPKGKPGLTLANIFPSESEMKRRALVLLQPTIWYRGGSVKMEYQKGNGQGKGWNTVDFAAMFPDTGITGNIVIDGEYVNGVQKVYELPPDKDKIAIKATMNAQITGEIVSKNKLSLLKEIEVAFDTQTKIIDPQISISVTFEKEINRSLPTGEHEVELKGYVKLISKQDEYALTKPITKKIKVDIKPKVGTNLEVSLKANPQNIIFADKDMNTVLTANFALNNFSDTSKISSILINFVGLQQFTILPTLKGSKNITATIPKSIMDNQQMALKDYTVEVTYFMKDGTQYKGDSSTVVVVSRQPPNEDLKVRLSVPQRVRAGDEFSAYVSATYSGEEEVSYNIYYNPAYLSYMDSNKRSAILWYDKIYAGTSKAVVGSASTYIAVEYDEKYIRITEPEIYPKISVAGSLKENRKVILKDTSSSPTHYPVTSTNWTIEPVTESGTSAVDIKYTTLSGQNIEVLFKKAGKYRVSFENKNSAGYEGESSTIITILPDENPVVGLEIPENIYREPSNGYANLRGFMSFMSTDNDLYWFNNAYYRYNADNDEDFEEHDWIPFTSPILDKEFTLPLDKIGRYQLRIDMYEKYGQETIPAFVEQDPISTDNWADHRRATVIKEFEVSNVAPEFSFTPSAKEKVDVIIDVNLDGYSLTDVQSRVNSILRNRLAEASIDAKITVKEAPRMNIYDSYFIATVNPNNVNKLRIYEDIKCSHNYELFAEVDTPPNQVDPSQSSFAGTLLVSKYGIYYTVNDDGKGLALYFIDYNSKKVELVTQTTMINYRADAPKIERINNPSYIAHNQNGDVFWIDNTQATKYIYKWNPETKQITVAFSSSKYINAIEVGADNNLYFTQANGTWTDDGRYYVRRCSMDLYYINNLGNVQYYRRCYEYTDFAILHYQAGYTMPTDPLDYTAFYGQVLLSEITEYGNPEIFLFDTVGGSYNDTLYYISSAWYDTSRVNLQSRYLNVGTSNNIFYHRVPYWSIFISKGTTFTSPQYFALSGNYWERGLTGFHTLVSVPPNMKSSTAVTYHSPYAGGYYTEKMRSVVNGNARGLYLEYIIPYDSARKVYTDYIGDIDPGNTSNTVCYTLYPASARLPTINDPKLYLQATSKSVEINEYEEGRKKFYATVNSGVNPSLADTTLMNKAITGIKTKGIQFYALGTSSTSAGLNQFVNTLEQQGVSGNYIDGTNLDAAMESLAQSIINNSVHFKENNDIYLLEGESISLTPHYQDYESDDKHTHKLMLTHEPEYFENSKGLFADAGKELPSLPEAFDKVGKYTVYASAQDKPVTDTRFSNYWLWGRPDIKNIYVHRAPVPAPVVKLTNNGTGYNVTQYSDSYDLDHVSKENRGIIQTKWWYKSASNDEWIEGILPSTIPYNANYHVKLEVMDEEYTTSSKTINVPDNKPVALFQLNKNPIEQSYTLIYGTDLVDMSFDPMNYPIEKKEWIIERGSTLISSGDIPKLSYGDVGVGDYVITLRVQNSLGVWSEPCIKTLKVVKDLTPPTVTLNPMERDWKNEDVTVQVTVNDNVDNAGASSFMYAWSDSPDIPGTAFTTTSSSNSSVVQINNGTWYLFVQAKDSSGNASEMVVGGPYKVDKVLPTLNRINIDGSTAYKKGNTYWIRAGQYADVRLQAKETLSGLVSSALVLSSDKSGALYDWNGALNNFTMLGNTSKINVTKAEESYKDSLVEGLFETKFTIQGLSECLEDLSYRFTDNAGNDTEYQSMGLKLGVDATPPIVVVTPEERPLSRLEAIATVMVFDYGSGVDRIRYLASESQAYPSQSDWNIGYDELTNITIAEDGIWYLHIEAFDNVGNKTYVVKGPYLVDGFGPVITINPASTDWINAPLMVLVSAVDKMSEFEELRYSVLSTDNRPEYDYAFATDKNAANIELKNDGIWFIHVEASDSVGNVSYKMGGEYKLDQVKPTVTISPANVTIVGAEAATASIPVTITASDDRSGLRSVTLKRTFEPFTGIAFGTPQITYTTITDLLPHSLTLAGEGRYKLEVSAYDNAGNITTVTGSYTMLPNSPPEVEILGTLPSYLYEGDDITLRFLATDTDLEMLTANIEIYRESNRVWQGSAQVSPSDGIYSIVKILTIRNTVPGEYTAHVTVTDAQNATATDTYTFNVNELGVTGSVSHTELWEQNRQKYNTAAIAAGREEHAPDVFFEGERFMLHAETTTIDPQSTVTPLNVQVSIVGTSFSTYLDKTTDTKFDKGWWEERMPRWGARPLDFLFQVAYSNGTIKSDTVRIYISGDDYWRLRLLF